MASAEEKSTQARHDSVAPPAQEADMFLPALGRQKHQINLIDYAMGSDV